MAQIDINVLNGTPFNTDSSDSILEIIVTNENEIDCEPGTNAYYHVKLSDGTNSVEYVFAVPQTGPIPEDHEETFVVENDVLGTIETKSCVIYFTPNIV